MITIKKYPNRRLYNTSTSQYINLEGIKALVDQREEFCVVDSKSNEDVTKSILLQIISESESNDNQALLTNTLLKQLIRYYDSDMQVYLRQYLEQSLVAFIEQQDKMHAMMQNVVSNSPFSLFNKIMEQNMEMWSPSYSTKKSDKE